MKTIDLAIIGGGPAGYTAAERAAQSGLSVTLFEKNGLGGVCLNEGCIPTKTLLYSAKLFDNLKNGAKYGVGGGVPEYDYTKIIARKTKTVRKLTAGIKSRLNACGVEIVIAAATITGMAGNQIMISADDETYQAAKLILCTGSESVIPPIPGLDREQCWTSREALVSAGCPKSLLIIGGGVIGMEFASFFNSLGATVEVVEMTDEILGGMDKEIAAALRAEYSKKGIKFYLNSRVTAIKDKEVTIQTTEGEKTLSAEQLLLSAGRRPILDGFGLEVLGLEKERNGLRVNDQMQTSNPSVYACGDITGYSMLAHTAVREAEVAINHILDIPDTMRYRAIPGVVYTNPEAAGTGLTEEQLQQKGIPYEVKHLPMTFSGRFVAENEGGNGICKILVSEKNTILGVHLLGNPASELITIASMAIEQDMSLSEWAKIVFPHPTVAEILKECIVSKD